MGWVRTSGGEKHFCLCLVWGLIPKSAWGLPPPTPSRQTAKSLFTFTKHWHCPQPSQHQQNRDRAREKPISVTIPGLRYYSSKPSLFRPPWTTWFHLKETTPLGHPCTHLLSTLTALIWDTPYQIQERYAHKHAECGNTAL